MLSNDVTIVSPNLSVIMYMWHKYYRNYLDVIRGNKNNAIVIGRYPKRIKKKAYVVRWEVVS